MNAIDGIKNVGQSTATVGKTIVREVKTWGLGEWGSIASILGVAFYFWDKRKK